MPQRPPPGSMPGMVPPDVASMMEQGFAQQAQQQKTSIQQAPQLGSNANPLQQQPAQPFQHQQSPREVGTLTEEAKMVVTDVAEGVRDAAVDMVKDILGLRREPKSQEEVAKMQQFHQSWKNLDAQQQQAAQNRLRAEQQRKEMQAEMDKQKKEQEAAAKAQQDQNFVPHGKVSGQAALDKMQQDRKGMGGASG
jgi:uncharacterized protein with von Willebrand factor type A (vWA) domain